MMRKQYGEALILINSAVRFLPQVEALFSGLYQLRGTVLMHLK